MNPTNQQDPVVAAVVDPTPAVAVPVPQAPQVAAPSDDLRKLFDQMAEKIIEQQEAIIGPIAVQQAQRVTELKINWPQHEVGIDGNLQVAIDDLVQQYKDLFGQIAVETCKAAVAHDLAKLTPEQLPDSLR